jgi:hypothetical protein
MWPLWHIFPWLHSPDIWVCQNLILASLCWRMSVVIYHHNLSILTNGRDSHYQHCFPAGKNGCGHVIMASLSWRKDMVIYHNARLSRIMDVVIYHYGLTVVSKGHVQITSWPHCSDERVWPYIMASLKLQIDIWID